MKTLQFNNEILFIQDLDHTEQLNWADANSYCENLGDGWRLPSINELNEIYLQRDSYNFAQYGYWAYWSLDEIDLENARIFCGDDQTHSSKNDKYYIRAVKTKIGTDAKILNIVPENPNLTLIALNPTEEAIKNKSVFSRDEAFWNLLIKAGILRPTVKEINLNNRALEVFENQNHTNIRLGFADLLPLVVETNSKKVRIPADAAKSLFLQIPNLKNTKKIALLGEKVVNAFAREFNLIRWEKLEISNNRKKFGKIGDIVIDNNIEIFAMPFPINNSIPSKHEYYKLLLDN